MLKYISILLIGLSFPVYGQSALDDFGDFLDYTIKNQKITQEYHKTLNEIGREILDIQKNKRDKSDGEYASMAILGSNILVCVDLMGDIYFAQNALLASNGTEEAFQMIFSRINNRVEELKIYRKYMSEDLGWIKNNQVIYLGNDARKIIAKYIKQTEGWVDKSSAFRPKAY